MSALLWAREHLTSFYLRKGKCPKTEARPGRISGPATEDCAIRRSTELGPGDQRFWENLVKDSPFEVWGVPDFDSLIMGVQDSISDISDTEFSRVFQPQLLIEDDRRVQCQRYARQQLKLVAKKNSPELAILRCSAPKVLLGR